MHDLSVITSEFGNLDAYRQCPPFWPATPDQGGQALLDSLRDARIRIIGRTGGGREIPAVEYGEHEATGATCDNLASAVSATVGDPDPTALYPQAFYGDRRRTRPSLCFQGALHGCELTGTAAALNLCRIIETGLDLRGRPWPRLAEHARACRLTVIPWLNADGVARWPLPNPVEAPEELVRRCAYGVDLDGAALRYPAFKNAFPISPESTRFLGAYFNDAGVNLQYDFCRPVRQPETLAWMHYYLEERPDAVLIMHGNAGTLFGPPEANLPEGFQHEISRIAGAVRQRLVRDGVAIGRMSWAGLPGFGKPVLNQVNAVYHVCGALPLLCEFPTGHGSAAFTADELLDIGLTVFEEILLYGLHDGFRPYEWREKVLTRQGKATARGEKRPCT